MSDIQYKYIEHGDRKVLTAWIAGDLRLTDSESNASFDTLYELLRTGQTEDTDRLLDLFDREFAVNRAFTNLSERVSVSGGSVFFDGDPVNNTLSEHILRLIDAGDNPAHLVNFWEKIAQNPSKASRKHLMDWLSKEDFSITVDGDIIGYKGLQANGTSIHSGPGIVNGVSVDGYLDNSEGNVIELPRSKVDANRFDACSYGLHVGTHHYANWFGRGLIVEVLVNPRDVVMVPHGESDKMRVCRYKVGKVANGLRDTAIVHDYEEPENDWDEEYYDTDEDYAHVYDHGYPR